MYSRQEIRKDLKNVYSTRDGQLPDMSKLIKKKHHYVRNTIIFLIIILAFLTFVSWLGFTIFSGTGGNSKGLKVTLEAPKEIASGAEIVYTIKYENKEKTPLQKIELSVHYPQGFVFTNASPMPENDYHTTWQLDALEQGGQGEIQIRGRLVGEMDEEKIMTATMAYWPDNFNSQFQVDETVRTKITSSVISLNIEGPNQILEDTDVEYSIKYKNETDNDLNDIRLKVDYPEGFVFDSASPKAEKRDDEKRHLDDTWLVGALPAGQEQEIKVKGQLKVQDNQELTLKLEAEIKQPSGDYFLQQEKSFTTRVIGKELSSKLVINQSDQTTSVGFGEALNYSLIVKNIGQEEIGDLQVVANLNAFPKELLDWTSLQDDNKGKASDNTITWTKKEIPQLENLLGGGEVTINWQVKISQDADVSGDNLRVDNFVEATVNKLNGEEANFATKSNLVTAKINSDVELLAAARYFNDDNLAVGSGPLPPAENQTTKYRIYWRVVNTFHELTNLKVSAVLPDYVSWTNKTNFSKGDITYNSSTREITWQLNRLPTSLKEVEGDFEIAFTPTSDHVGKIIILMPTTKLTATDSETDGQIAKTVNAISTDLVSDPNAQGKGIVTD